MPKRRNLNGIPHNITHSYFGTERYYSRGYMGDWLLNAVRQLRLTNASLNVLESSFTPKELDIYPLKLNAKALKDIIEKELINNGFDTDFIMEAHIDFQFPNSEHSIRRIYCYPYLIDKEGGRYEPGRIIVEGFEQKFDPFDEMNIHPNKMTIGRNVNNIPD